MCSSDLGVAGIQHQLATCQLSHKQLAVTAETDDGGGGTTTLGTRDHLGSAALEHGHHRIGGAQIDANDSPHAPHADVSEGSGLNPDPSRTQANGLTGMVKPCLNGGPRVPT